MSHSYDFCKRRCADKDVCGFYDRKWDDVSEYPFVGVIKKELPLRYVLKGDGITVSVEIYYNPNADFQYFTSYSATTDGTMIFDLDAMKKLCDMVVFCETYFKEAGAPHNGSHITYTVGDFVVIREYGKEFATKEKPWLRERLTVMLPIRYEVREGVERT